MMPVGWNRINKRKLVGGEFREVEVRWVGRSCGALWKGKPLNGFEKRNDMI